MSANNFGITKHWLFDFDGTLVDSMPYWSSCMISVLDDHNVPHGNDLINIITPLGTAGTIAYFQKLGLDMSENDIKNEIASKLTPFYLDIIPEKKNVIQCLQHMKGEGFKLHVLTASPHGWLDPCLKRLGMYELFENVWSSDDFGTGKTDPEIYVSAAKKIGVKISDVTFLDDNINADKTAKLAGMKVIGVYDETSKHDEEIMRKTLDFYVHDFKELEDLIFKS